jgi:hypothetical protein
MRAKSIGFQRGLDPMDQLNIGRVSLRQFREAEGNRDYNIPLGIIMSVLEDGSVSEEEIKKFIIFGIRQNINRRPLYISWYSDFFKTCKVIWDPILSSLKISFTNRLPKSVLFSTYITKEYHEANDHQWYFRILTASFNEHHSEYGMNEEHLIQDDDQVSFVRFLINQINRVAIETYKNID